MDYGDQGVEETLYHLAVANTERAIAYAGLGSTFDEAVKPACLDLDGTRIGFERSASSPAICRNTAPAASQPRLRVIPPAGGFRGGW